MFVTMQVPWTAYVKFHASNKCVVILKRERYECSTKANKKRLPFLLHRHPNLPCYCRVLIFPKDVFIYHSAHSTDNVVVRWILTL